MKRRQRGANNVSTEKITALKSGATCVNWDGGTHFIEGQWGCNEEDSMMYQCNDAKWCADIKPDSTLGKRTGSAMVKGNKAVWEQSSKKSSANKIDDPYVTTSLDVEKWSRKLLYAEGDIVTAAGALFSCWEVDPN